MKDRLVIAGTSGVKVTSRRRWKLSTVFIDGIAELNHQVVASLFKMAGAAPKWNAGKCQKTPGMQAPRENDDPLPVFIFRCFSSQSMLDDSGMRGIVCAPGLSWVSK
jgi:hypothetical protein